MSFGYSEKEIQWKLRECLNLWIWGMHVDKAVNWEVCLPPKVGVSS